MLTLKHYKIHRMKGSQIRYIILITVNRLRIFVVLIFFFNILSSEICDLAFNTPKFLHLFKWLSILAASLFRKGLFFQFFTRYFFINLFIYFLSLYIWTAVSLPSSPPSPHPHLLSPSPIPLISPLHSLQKRAGLP